MSGADAPARGWTLPRWGARGTAGAAIPASLAVEGVALAYERRPALRGIDLAVPAGEVLGLLGHSGCGKTTLLRLIAGLERPDAGRVLIDGRLVSTPGRAAPPEARGVGVVFQDYALFPHLTIRDNVTFGLRSLGRGDAEATALRALGRVGLAGHAGLYPHQLSGGEQQRVALARALAPRPGVVLMDEPFSNLDRRLRDQVREETAELLREVGTTAVIVTHDPEEAMRVSDRIALMRDGRIVQVGTAEDLYLRPLDPFCARFFADANEFEAEVLDGAALTSFGAFHSEVLAGAGRAVVLVRPRAVSLSALPRGARPGPGSLLGRLREVRFLGDACLCDVAVQGLERPLRALVPAPAPAGEGGDVEVSVSPGGVLVFAAPPS